MSIANVFAFIFETQGAKKVVSELKGLEQAEKQSEQSAKKLGDAEDKLKNKNTELAKSVSGLISTYFGFKKILSEVMGFAKGGEDLTLLANSAGVGAEQLERYGIALQNYGGGLSSAASTLSALNQQMQDIKFGKGGAIQEAAIRYGISIEGKNGLATGEEMLYNIAKRMQSLGKQEQLDLGRKIGLDPATIALLQTGVAGLTAELERASQFTLYRPEDIENSRKFQMALREFRNSLEKVWATASRALLPVLTAIMNGVSKFFQYLADHKGFVLGFLAAISVALGIIAIKSIIATAPFWLMVAAIAAVGVAIGLLVDDFVTFMEGGDSCIGWVADRFADFFLWLFEMGDKIADFFKGMWQGIADVFTGIWDGMVAKITGVFNWIVEKWRAIKKWIPFMGDDEADIAITGQDALNSTSTPLTTMSTSNITNGGNNSVRIDTVNVNTQATDAQGISQGIGGALTTEFNDVLLQNTGGAVA